MPSSRNGSLVPPRLLIAPETPWGRSSHQGIRLRFQALTITPTGWSRRSSSTTVAFMDLLALGSQVRSGSSTVRSSRTSPVFAVGGRRQLPDEPGAGTLRLQRLRPGTRARPSRLPEGAAHPRQARRLAGPLLRLGQPVSYNAGPDPSGSSVANLGNGQFDLLVGNAYGDVLILAGQGDGTFRPSLDSGRSVALAVADLNGNNQPDFVFADQGLDRVSVQFGGATPAPFKGKAQGLLAPGAVALADLNGDGIKDLIVANSGGNNVLVYPGLRGGKFGPEVSGGKGFFTGTDPVGVTVADLGNGRQDLVIADKGSNDVTILLNQGGFKFVPGPRLNLKSFTPPAIGPVSPTIVPLPSTQQGIGPVATAIVPSATGGPPSLAVSLSGSNQVWVVPGVGGGFFNDQRPTIFNVGTNPGPIFFGNFDGLPDLVSVNAGSNSLTLISDFNSPDFTVRTIASGGVNPVSAFAFESGGGFESLVVGNEGDGVLALLRGGPRGSPWRPP